MFPTTQPERLLPLKAVVDRTSLSRAFVYDLMKQGGFPKPIRLSTNRIAWPESAVAAWIAAKIGEAA